MDTDLLMRSHTVATVRSCFAALHRICSVRRSLTPQALLTLVHALLVSNVDYCNPVLAGVSAHLLDRLQSMLMLMLSRSSWQGSLNTSAPYSVNFTSCVFQREFNCCCVFSCFVAFMTQYRHTLLTVHAVPPMSTVGLGRFGFFKFGSTRFVFQSQVLGFVFFGFSICTPPQCKSILVCENTKTESTKSFS